MKNNKLRICNEWFKLKIKEKNIKSIHIAKKLCVTKSIVSAWINGKQNIPLSRAMQIASLLDLNWKDIKYLNN